MTHNICGCFSTSFFPEANAYKITICMVVVVVFENEK